MADDDCEMMFFRHAAKMQSFEGASNQAAAVCDYFTGIQPELNRIPNVAKACKPYSYMMQVYETLSK
jgi:hypothetical protein